MSSDDLLIAIVCKSVCVVSQLLDPPFLSPVANLGASAIVGGDSTAEFVSDAAGFSRRLKSSNGAAWW